MKFYGHANLQQNELQNAVLSTLTEFPADPRVGQIAFVNSIVYICVRVTPLPAVWVPLTQEITAYTHNQQTPAYTWNINHGLNTTDVNVQIYDTSNVFILPDEITIVDNNNVSVTFSNPQDGKAVIVSGHFTGITKPTYAYTHFQNTASNTWVINHMLGYMPIVRVFIGVDEVQPSSITHPTLNQTIITFTTPVAGYARLI